MRDDSWYWETWFAQLKQLVEDGQIHIETRHTGGSVSRWVANGFQANGGPVVIVADLSKPPHTAPDDPPEGGA